MSFLYGASIGIQILCARRNGEKNFSEAGIILTTGLIFFLFLGIFLSAAGYASSQILLTILTDRNEILNHGVSFLKIRFLGISFYLLNSVFIGFYDAAGKTVISMTASATTAFSNIFLNWILIFGNLGFSSYGVNGAAAASSISGFFGFLVLTAFIFSKEYRKYFYLNSYFNTAVLSRIFHKGIAPSLEGFLMHLSFLFFYRLSAQIGTVSIASTNIIVSIMSISFMPGYAFGIAATTLMGQSLGEKKFRRAEFAVYRSLHYAVLLMGSLGILFILFRRQIISFFTQDASVINDAVPALIFVSLAQTGDALQLVMSSSLRGAGFVFRVLFVNASVSFGIMLPFAYFLGIQLQLGTSGLWSSIFIWLFSLGFIFYFIFRKINWREGIA